MGDPSNGVGSQRVKIKGKSVLRKGDKINVTQGDEAGSIGGITSATIKGAAEFMSGWGKVKAEGQMVAHQACIVGQNGPGGKNIPVGMLASLSVTHVKVGVDIGVTSDPVVSLIRCDDPPAPPPPSQDELDRARDSANAKGGDNCPQPDPKTQQKIREKYDKVMSGQEPPPPGITPDKMKAAMEGVNGQRIPMTFTPTQFSQFQSELAAVLRAGGVTDASVYAIGSGTSVFSANPAKNLKPWSSKSDCDLSVFSNQAVAQAEAQKCAASKKYGIYKNGGSGEDDGFGDTPVGKKLMALALRWTMILYGDGAADGVEFKLNLTTKPWKDKLDAIPAVTP